MTKFLQAATYSDMLAPLTAVTTARTAALDCAGADYATIIVHLGIEKNTDSTNVVLMVDEGNDTNTFTTFDSNLNSITVDNVAAAIAVRHIDLKGRKRYLRLTVTPDTTTNGDVLFDATGILSSERKLATVGTNVVVG